MIRMAPGWRLTCYVKRQDSSFSQEVCSMSRRAPFFVFAIVVCLAALLGQRLMAQSYSLPNDNTSCPGNCRVVPWQAGSDLWNGGTLPNYPSVNCTGLAGNGTTNDGPALQACINS